MKSKLSTAKKSKTIIFSRVFHPKKLTIFLGIGKSKLIFGTKNEDFEQCARPAGQAHLNRSLLSNVDKLRRCSVALLQRRCVFYRRPLFDAVLLILESHKQCLKMAIKCLMILPTVHSPKSDKWRVKLRQKSFSYYDGNITIVRCTHRSKKTAI